MNDKPLCTKEDISHLRQHYSHHAQTQAVADECERLTKMMAEKEADLKMAESVRQDLKAMCVKYFGHSGADTHGLDYTMVIDWNIRKLLAERPAYEVGTPHWVVDQLFNGAKLRGKDWLDKSYYVYWDDESKRLRNSLNTTSLLTVEDFFKGDIEIYDPEDEADRLAKEWYDIDDPSYAQVTKKLAQFLRDRVERLKLVEGKR